ncbi:MAG TPA: carboxypeptidase regulatory-like domain-containing protein [Oscillatoriaceae cyanobacterium]
MFKRRALIGLLLITGLLSGCDVKLVDATGAGIDTPDVTVVGGDVPDHSGWDGGDYSDPSPTIVNGPGASNPVIQSFTANPTNQVQQGQAITFTVVAYDPNHEVLQYNWSATGGTISSNTGAVVSWTPPAKAGVYTISVTLQNKDGGFVMGSQNVTVLSDGTSQVSGNAPTPTPPAATPAPTSTPAPTPTPTPTTAATPTPAPSANPLTDKGSVVGTVDDTHGAVANATVVVSSADGAVPFSQQATTAADGSFRVDGVPAGIQIVVSASKPGDVARSQIVTVTKGQAAICDFTGNFVLEPQQ